MDQKQETPTAAENEQPAAALAPTVASDAAATDEGSAEGGEQKLSKKQLKKMAKGKFKVKNKDPNRWAKKEKEDKPKPKKDPKVEFVNNTPKGEKKDLSGDMAPAYQPKAVEAAWQDWWEASGFYKCSVEEARDRPAEERFVMVIPPPNVTGSLHCGHALSYTIEDCVTRWHRMMGHSTLWVPGEDHAGIATQSVVERRLLKTENITRHDLGREKFLERVFQWKDQYQENIRNQIRCLGLSVDWTREAFTMDEQRSKAVTEAFVRLFEDGLIYRDTRLVNWSCKMKTALSDLEVDYIDLEGKSKMTVPGHNPERKYEFGTLTSFAYKVKGSEEEVVVATTRLETMLGDTAVAVHPEDPRYKHLHGKMLQHPFADRTIPIVTDAELVDMEFGTGAVKITPAHDPNDYLCGKRHNLPFINLLTEEGAINHMGGKEFEGMMRYDARIAVEKALAEKGLLKGKEPHAMRLGLCSRSGDVIEPLIVPQWYVNCSDMAARAVDAVRSGDLKIVPTLHEATWYRWLENIRDWCISRQLWWGHRIPAYFVTVEGEEPVDRNSSEGAKRWVAARSEEEAREKAAQKLNISADKVQLQQDEDVLDTWFSSGLFPFSVFNWPESNEDLDVFFPNTLLETGHDILFFWVARMVMMGQQLTGKLPFSEVYLHSMVRDKYGRKMSKSLGNVVDPLEVINGCSLDKLLKKLEEGNLPPSEVAKAKKGQKLDFPNGIPECGADGFRLGLLAYTGQGKDVNLDIQRVVGYRNFCNKLWNATRFALSNVGDDFKPVCNMEDSIISHPGLNHRDKFILSRLSYATSEANRCMKEYQFGAMVEALYSFWLYDLCDVYLELIKPVMNLPEDDPARVAAKRTLYICLDHGLRLLHPCMPFVTEELWQRLPGGHEEKSIMIAKYPQERAEWRSEEAETYMASAKSAIHAARSLRSEYDVKPQARPSIFVKSSNEEAHNIMLAMKDDIQTLSKAGSVECLLDQVPPQGCAIHVVSDSCQILILLKGLVDFASEISKLEKKLEKMNPSFIALENRMTSDSYATKVPDNIRQQDAEKMESLTKEKEHIVRAIEGFQRLLESDN